MLGLGSLLGGGLSASGGSAAPSAAAGSTFGPVNIGTGTSNTTWIIWGVVAVVVLLIFRRTK